MLHRRTMPYFGLSSRSTFLTVYYKYSCFFWKVGGASRGPCGLILIRAGNPEKNVKINNYQVIHRPDPVVLTIDQDLLFSGAWVRIRCISPGSSVRFFSFDTK